MTTRTFPSISPTSMSWELISNTQQFVGISGAIQVAQRAGQRWAVTLEFGTLASNDRSVLQAFVIQVLGLADNFTLSPADHSPRGAFGGTPKVSGGGQTGNTLAVDNVFSSVQNWVRAGDFFQDSLGRLTISFVPELRAAPANRTVLIMGPSATGVFRFVQPRMGWSSRPAYISSMTIECIEDVLA